MDVKTSAIGLMLAALFALIPGAIAKKRGYLFLGWWCYGVLIWPVAILHALLLKPRRKTIMQTMPKPQ